MQSKFQISLNHLKDNQVKKFKENFLFNELDIEEEKDLKFVKPIFIEGKTYIANENLILILNIKFFISMPCSICNDFVEKEIIIKNLHIIKNLSKIPSIYDFKDEIRNACFLEIPTYVECKEKCPERKNIKKYLNKSTKNFPFSNLKE
jgi:hypothetical protein